MGWPHGSRQERGSPGKDRGDQGVLGAFEPGDLSLTQLPGACFIPAQGAQEDRVVPDLRLLGKTDCQRLFQPGGSFFPKSNLGVIQRQREQAPGQVGMKAGIIRPLGGQGFAVPQREPMRLDRGGGWPASPGVAQSRVVIASASDIPSPVLARLAPWTAEFRFSVMIRSVRPGGSAAPARVSRPGCRQAPDAPRRFQVGESAAAPSSDGRPPCVLDRRIAPSAKSLRSRSRTGLPHARQGEDPGLAKVTR
jgi:hypothetical protein